MILTKQEAITLRKKYGKIGFKLIVRRDSFARGLIEAICEHGVGHPIPESVEHMKRVTKQETWAIHGCDGCCHAWGAVKDWGTQSPPPQTDAMPDGSKP